MKPDHLKQLRDLLELGKRPQGEKWISNAFVKAAIGSTEAIEALLHESERNEILLKIADELITNENAKEDWENAKRTRIM